MGQHDTIQAIAQTARELLPKFGGDRVGALQEAARRHGVKPSDAGTTAPAKPGALTPGRGAKLVVRGVPRTEHRNGKRW